MNQGRIYFEAPYITLALGSFKIRMNQAQNILNLVILLSGA